MRFSCQYFHSEASKELLDAESDDDSCQIITEMNSTAERRNSAVSTPSNVSSNQSVPVLTSNAGVWKNIVPNMNLPIMNVNQMLASNMIDSSLFTRQTVIFFGELRNNFFLNFAYFNKNNNCVNSTASLSFANDEKIFSKDMAEAVLFHFI